jgi:DNA-binding XRE family transcriptional regulator
MATVKEVISEITNPLRQNDLESRRRKLGLTRVALGRILGVDPATVFRRERGPLFALWDYALRGIEAEASSKWDRGELRSFKSNLDYQNFWPHQFEARGHSYTAEKMKEARREHARKKPTRTKSAIDKEPAFPGGSGERRRKGQSPEEAITRIADRYIHDSDGKK